MTDGELASVWATLDRSAQADLLGNALADVILSEWQTYMGPMIKSDQMTMGDATTILADQAMKLLEPLMPALGAKLQEVAGPATEKAMAIVMPKIKEQIPIFAAITGLVAGALVLVGLILAKKFL